MIQVKRALGQHQAGIVTKTTRRWPSSVPNQWRLIPMVVSSLVVARSQLLTAIDLFFNDRDPISVHALAGNAREILESLCKLAAVEPITELLSRDHPDKPKKDFYAAINLYRKCEQAVLNQFNDSKNEYLLYVRVEDYFAPAR